MRRFRVVYIRETQSVFMTHIDPNSLTEVQTKEEVQNHIGQLYETTQNNAVNWVNYDVSQWAGRLGDSMAGLVERGMNAMDATSMMHSSNPYQHRNMSENLEGINKEIQVILEGAKRSTDNVGYNVMISDLGKGQSYDKFHRFVKVEGSGGNKDDLPIAQGCRMLGSLASVANSKYVLIVSASHKHKREWTWTLVRQKNGDYQYLKFEDGFPHYEGVINEVGKEENKEYGTIVKMFDYEMSSPERAATGKSFRRALSHRIPEPPIPIRIIDNRWGGEYVYRGVSTEVQDYKNLLTGSQEFRFNHNKYGLVEVKVLSFDMSDEVKDVRQRFISNLDNSRFLTVVNGQTHHTESPYKVKTGSGLGEASTRSLITVELLETSTVKEQELFRLERRGFKNKDEEREFVSEIYDELETRINPSELVPDSTIENVSKSDFSVTIDKSTVKIEESGHMYLNLDVSPYLNEDEQTILIQSMDDRVTVDLAQSERREITAMLQVNGLEAGEETDTDLLFILDGELACTKCLTVSVRKDETQEESTEEDNENEVTISGKSVNGYRVPEDEMSKQEVKQVLNNEIAEFARECYNHIDETTLSEIGYERDGGEFYNTVSQLGSDSLKKEIANRIRNKFVASEETRAGYLAEDIASGLRACDNESEEGESLEAGLTGCEPDLVSERDGQLFGLQLKMGINTMNSDMEGGFDHARRIVDGVENQTMILGIVQGTREQALANLGSNISNLSGNLLCGNELFYWLTGNEEVAKNFFSILQNVESDVDLGEWEETSIDDMINQKAEELADKVREDN